ncbi:MAG TPA: class I SAM-dependent methyltransferase [Pyrinomonadaceae bacterium]|nr:class I SAM-dependent methyltransferase [Pyrinomonadaceae bacterium]
MTDTVERFSNRVENYVKYRPDYPQAIVPFLMENCGLTRESIIADIGCGPGISSRMFLENGNRVFGVEPNAAMREEAGRFLVKFPWFIPVDGTSDHTTLSDGSVDMVVAAQAFHWFDPNTTRPEFHRILKPGGHIVLIWNERQLDTTPFLIEYEAFLVKYAYDYGSVRHENIQAKELSDFFQKEYGSATFENFQDFDFEGLKGRMLSASYMPNETDAIFEEMIKELRALFAKHAENDRIKVFYDTKVYFSPVRAGA